MATKNFIKILIPKVIKNYLDVIQKRLEKLEYDVKNLGTCVDNMIESPKYKTSTEFGFNGQEGRKRIFNDIMRAFKFGTIIETGTWTGNTTGYMAETTNLPIYSTEIDRRYYLISKMRLADFQNIRIENTDSRPFIREISNREEIVETLTFFYLDAHWYDDLPLREEVEIIAKKWKRFVIMVDDFKVPDDAGYGYDRYGNGKELSISYLGELLKKYNLIAYFPSLPSVMETGAKQGCVVLTCLGPLIDGINKISTLRSINSL